MSHAIYKIKKEFKEKRERREEEFNTKINDIKIDINDILKNISHTISDYLSAERIETEQMILKIQEQAHSEGYKMGLEDKQIEEEI